MIKVQLTVFEVFLFDNITLILCNFREFCDVYTILRDPVHVTQFQVMLYTLQ